MVNFTLQVFMNTKLEASLVDMLWRSLAGEQTVVQTTGSLPIPGTQTGEIRDSSKFAEVLTNVE